MVRSLQASKWTAGPTKPKLTLAFAQRGKSVLKVLVRASMKSCASNHRKLAHRFRSQSPPKGSLWGMTPFEFAVALPPRLGSFDFEVLGQFRNGKKKTL